MGAKERPSAAELVRELRRKGKPAIRAGMARYGLPSGKAFGWSVGDLCALARRVGHDHALAAALWKSGWYEARMLACFVDEPERGASDERNFVSKGVSWALRSVGKRNRRLHADALALSRKLARSPQRAAAWVGRDALRDLQSPATRRRMARKRA